MVTLNKKLDKIKKNSYEITAWQSNLAVCGIDEVGRGCLAGPLVTAAVVLIPGRKSPLLKDSKLMDKEELLRAYTWLLKNSWFGIGIVNSRTVDRYNVWQATLIAMKKALVNLLVACPLKPSLVLVDAMPLNLNDTGYFELDVHHFPKGEHKSISIAAASIIAKVRRDALLMSLDPVFPGYQLGRHKGYGTAIHRQALQDHGSTIIHRIDFIDNFVSLTNNEYEEQQALF